MTTDPIRYEVAGGVATVTLNRPEHGNALNWPLVQRLGDVVHEVGHDDAVRAVLLRAEGAQFCVGGDINAIRRQGNRGRAVYELADTAHRAVRGLADLEKVVVVAVQGAAAGAGLALVLLADVVIAAESATFTTAYTAIGLTPDCGLSWLLPRAIGTAKALDLTLRPRRITAEDAAQLGIVSTVVADDVLRDEAGAAVRRFAAGPHRAYGVARRLIRTSTADGFDAHLDLEAEQIAARADSAASRELVESFFRRV